MKQVLKAALKAAATYATSPDAMKYERVLLSGLGVALVEAIKGALGW